MTKYKLTHKTYYSPFWFCRSKWPDRLRVVELKVDNNEKREEVENYLRESYDDVFEWEFISKTYKLTDCGIK